jgi:hypothetical protein
MDEKGRGLGGDTQKHDWQDHQNKNGKKCDHLKSIKFS